jgi:hypothetical protein
MFKHCPFNGDISRWDVRNVEYMNFMFYDSKFSGNINAWNPINVTDVKDLLVFLHSPLYDKPPIWFNTVITRNKVDT